MGIVPNQRGIVFCPYGASSRGAGVTLLISRYLAQTQEVSSLACNGCVSICGRDEQTGFRRTLSSCFRCISEQQACANFVNSPDGKGVAQRSIGEWITPEIVEDSRRAAQGALTNLHYHEISITECIEPSFMERSGRRLSDLGRSSLDEQLARRMAMAAVRVVEGIQGAIREIAPSYMIIEGGDDYMAKIATAVCQKNRVSVLHIAWNKQERGVAIWKNPENKIVSPFVLDEISTMRPEVSTWPSELVDIAEQACALL